LGKQSPAANAKNFVEREPVEGKDMNLLSQICVIAAVGLFFIILWISAH
jgi:hypothetical protein